jgi:hypothetical protein
MGYQEGKGIRDNILGVSTARPLLFNDEACLLEFIKGRASVVGGAKAVSVLTSDNTEISDGETVTIGSVVYRFKDTMAQAYDVKRHGSTADTTLGNLAAAINASGTPGTEYFAGTLIHPYVSSSGVVSHALTITAKQGGTVANALATTETTSHMSWPDTTLGGGTGASDPGDDLKFTFGYVTGTQAVADATSVTETAGEMVVSNTPDMDLSVVLKVVPALSGKTILPKNSWLVVKSVVGTVGTLAGSVITVLRRRLEGTH